MAIALVPESPLSEWLAQLDEQIRRSPAFFAGRPVVVDISALPATDTKLPSLVPELQSRGIRVIGVEGADASWHDIEGWGWPPRISGGRPAGMIEMAPQGAAPAAVEPVSPEPEEPASLLIGENVRSGQTIVFPRGDVTVVGSVASGAEVIAGGSIHVYGTLRGRAIAGMTGNSQARIFCQRLEAELLAIDGLYRTADDMDAALRRRAVQAWLEGDAMLMAALD